MKNVKHHFYDWLEEEMAGGGDQVTGLQILFRFEDVNEMSSVLVQRFIEGSCCYTLTVRGFYVPLC